MKTKRLFVKFALALQVLLSVGVVFSTAFSFAHDMYGHGIFGSFLTIVNVYLIIYNFKLYKKKQIL